MTNKTKNCQYRKSKFMAGTIAALAFSMASNSSALAADITIFDLARINEDIANDADSGNTYFLGSNLDLADVEVGGPVWTYVQGTFAGTFNGNGHTISNLAAPLFDVIGDGTSTGGVLNVGLKTTSGGITGDASDNAVGVLAGTLSAGSTVSGVAVSGRISTVSEDVAGGLVGVANGEIINSSSSVSITTEDSSGTTGMVGGLVGNASGATISNSNSTGSISSTSGNTFAGGLVGQAGYGTLIVNSTSSSAVTIGSVGNELTGGAVGGLVGNAFITEITNSSASGAVTNVNGANATGGLVGNGYAVEITGAVASGAVTSSSSYTGGLLGKGDFEVAITGSSATGSVTVRAAGAALTNIGGLVGGGEGFIVFNSSAAGNVSVTAETKVQIIDDVEEIELGDVAYVGGLIGAGNAVTNSTASGSVTVSATDQANYIGGLAGYYETDGPIDTTNASGNVTVNAEQGARKIGGLVGLASGVSNSSASGTVEVMVTSGNVQEVGGLAGQIQGEEVANSSASGSVSISASDYSGDIGGLVGNSQSSIMNSSASGTVSVSESGNASINEGIGGLVGWITNSDIRNSSASGDVSALGAVGVGGLAGGFYYGEIENSEAHGDVSGLNVGGLAGFFDGFILDSVSDGSTTEDGVPVFQLTSNDAPNTVTVDGATQGLIDSVGPIGSPDSVTGIDSGAELLDTENDPLAWGENQYVNSGLPYLLSLRASGFYTDTTPTGSPVRSAKSADFFKKTRLYLHLSGDSAIRVEVSDFAVFGVRTVNERNLPFVMAILKEVNPNLLSFTMISNNVKKADIQLQNTYRLFQYLNGDTKITLRIADFTEFGVLGVTQANLPIMIKLLKAVDPATLNLKALNKAVRAANLELKRMHISRINQARK